MLHQFIKQLREKNNFSQEYMASILNISRPTYSQIETGEHDITILEAEKLAERFELSLESFLKEQLEVLPIVTLEKRQDNKKTKKNPQMRISVPQKNVKKFKEVLLYVLEKIGALPNIGEAVICKLFYFIDFDYYEKYESQLIGATYIKNHHGPTPAEFIEIIKQMEEDGDLVKINQKYFKFDQKKYLPIRKPDLSLFSGQEMVHIDSEIERFKDKNASEMRELTHKDVPWIGSEDLKPIDYESVFYRTPEFSVRKYNDDNLQ